MSYTPCMLRQALMFTNFKLIANGEKVYMGNSATLEVAGQSKVILKMTSGKYLTLNNVLSVPKFWMNLVSGFLLRKHNFRMVLRQIGSLYLKLESM